MAVNIKQVPTFQADQAKRALISFYQKPIAQVSTELFFTIGAIVFFALFAIRPTVITMTELVKEIEDKRTLKEALAKKVTALSSVSTEYFAIQDQLPVVDEAIPQQLEPQKVLRIIEKVASKHTLLINTLRLESVPARESADTEFAQLHPDSMPVIVGVEGSYASIRAFLEEIGTLRPLMTITNLTITQPAAEEITTSLTASFTILAHHYSSAVVEESTEQSESEELAL